MSEQRQDPIVEQAGEVGQFVFEWLAQMMLRVRDGSHPDRMMGTKEAAAYLDVSERTLHRMVKERRITPIMVNKTHKFREEDLRSVAKS